MSQNYNDTLNLPQTKFPMRAGLPKTEPSRLQNWEDQKLYEKLMERNEGKPLYVLHDGPPYANGDIHLGTALNKTLKDFIIRYKNMNGFKAPFVPGFDTHGLPTELKARKKAGTEKCKSMTEVELRNICREFALKYIDDQTNQFKRIGSLAKWDDPYITLLKEFEADQIEVFAQMACKGYIYKGLKPVYWCPECKTALAEAEIEYAEDECESIYVKFALSDDKGKLSNMGADINKTYFVIWTTTTWTLPGNVAICVGPRFTYCLVKWQDEYYVMAEELVSNAMKVAGKEDYEIIGKIDGSELEYMKAKHPFLDRESLVIVGEHVTLESGTGCVHTAPGHGVEDFDVCRNYPELEIIVPVDSNGRLTQQAGQFEGLKTNKANKEISEYLQKTGAMFSVEKIIHQYPHCWRCKKPVLFRATEQWFCSIDDFKDDAVKAIKDVEWIPGWGEDRITSMIKDRKDWCISRQRRWGVPIPIFFCKECNEPLIDESVMMAVAKMFREEGSDSWYAKSVEEILPKGTKCKKCSSENFEKEKDIMDVWFDSGVTHAAVLQRRDYLRYPADLYLEGADQYRGWFQSSLLTSVATKNIAPYKAVVTHGWVVDGEGRKMSKSLGNGIAPKEIIDMYGADILRLWVASSDYHADIRISKDILKQLSEAYRKIRNTARYILGNLCDFDPNKDMLPVEELTSLDKWALIKLNELTDKMKNGYDKFDFHVAYHSVHNFCVVDMSNFYLDVIKDRLYVEQANSKSRRAAQTAIYIILDSMTRLIAPILAYTADEIWDYMPHKNGDNKDSVVLNDINPKVCVELDDEFMSFWDRVISVRDDVKKALEIARKNKEIGKSLEAEVTLYCDDELYKILKDSQDDLAMIFIVSKVNVLKDGQGKFKAEYNKELSIDVKKAQGGKCERCWIHSDTVGQDEEHKTLCKRCAAIIKGEN
ncbi:MAG: isoleucine--tRNA ligase [Clostridia bacterium]|nr:isoleucine--tRNA ligase [Clostridia bacterium]